MKTPAYSEQFQSEAPASEFVLPPDTATNRDDQGPVEKDIKDSSGITMVTVVERTEEAKSQQDDVTEIT